LSLPDVLFGLNLLNKKAVADAVVNVMNRAKAAAVNVAKEVSALIVTEV
jgi:hypothetical protein